MALDDVVSVSYRARAHVCLRVCMYTSTCLISVGVGVVVVAVVFVVGGVGVVGVIGVVVSVVQNAARLDDDVWMCVMSLRSFACVHTHAQTHTQVYQFNWKLV